MMEPREVEAMIRRLMAREGGYVDHPADRGGPTKWGITLATLQAARQHPITASDVWGLGEAEAIDVYRRLWLDHSRLCLRQWPYRRLAEVTLDAAVMFSLGRAMAVKWVQEAINRRLDADETKLAVDGWAGPRTREAMLRFAERDLAADVVGARCRKHARVVEARPGQILFLEGWINRATEWVMPERAV